MKSKYPRKEFDFKYLVNREIFRTGKTDFEKPPVLMNE